MGGAGLGLSIVAAIAEAHGGSASVSSEVGKGSTFLRRPPSATRTRASFFGPNPGLGPRTWPVR
jgi:signal transduction histidine kinase